MNFAKLNQKKQMVKNKLAIGLDLAKSTHLVSFMLPDGMLLGKPFKMGQDRASFDKLWADASAVQQKHGLDGIVMAMEATGSFWEPLAHHFAGYPTVDLVFVSGLVMKRSRQVMDLCSTKNDPKDSYLIAQLAQEGKYLPMRLPRGVWAELRGLGNLRFDLLKARVAFQNRIQAVQDRYWPEREAVLKKCLGKTSLYLYEHCPFPQDILELGVEGVLPLVLTGSNRRRGRKVAEALVEAARDSIGVREGLLSARAELLESVEQCRMLNDQLARIESQLLALVRQTGYAELIASIPGVSELGAACLLGEIGDPAQYRNAKELVKLAGLNLVERQSGGKPGAKRESVKRISRMGRPLLRHLLYQMAVTTLRHNETLMASYLSLRLESKATVKALVANMCRLLRIVLAICKSRSQFRHRDRAADDVVSLKARLAARRRKVA